MSKYLVRIFVTGDMHFQADFSREQAEALLSFANSMLQGKSVQPKVNRPKHSGNKEVKEVVKHRRKDGNNLQFFIALLGVIIFLLLMFGGVFS